MNCVIGKFSHQFESTIFHFQYACLCWCQAVTATASLTIKTHLSNSIFFSFSTFPFLYIYPLGHFCWLQQKKKSYAALCLYLRFILYLVRWRNSNIVAATYTRIHSKHANTCEVCSCEFLSTHQHSRLCNVQNIFCFHNKRRAAYVCVIPECILFLAIIIWKFIIIIRFKSIEVA